MISEKAGSLCSTLASRRPARQRLLWFQASVFLSAFLLFQVQPMLSKALLPAFGGSYLVWGASMVFFQGMLLAGYAFGHVMQQWLGVRRYAWLQVLLLPLPLLFAPFNFDRLVTADTGGLPAPRVLAMLLGTAGAPFFMLATVSLVLQRWLAASSLPAGRNPYVLYAVSNAGSVLALLSYPVFVEPFMDLPLQGLLWWGGYGLLWLLHIGAWRVARLPATDAARQTGRELRPALGMTIRWLLLGAGGCGVLLAVTHVLTFDMAPVPFLWVLPLTLYLVAFIVTFKTRLWFPRAALEAFYWAVPGGVLLHILGQLRVTLPPAPMLLAHLGILFMVCWTCAASLVECRPRAEHQLTAFYLTLAAGSLIGSLAVSWVVPPISATLVEYPLALALACAAVGLARERPLQPLHVAAIETLTAMAVTAVTLLVVPLAITRWVKDSSLVLPVSILAIGLPLLLLMRGAKQRPLRLSMLVLTVCVAGAGSEPPGAAVRTVLTRRNYYGIYRVFDRGGIRYLQHGSTQHGRQHLDAAHAGTPLAYYHPTTSAAGVLMEAALPKRDIGMVGLGTGALSAYAGEGQHITIYELDPDNLPIAKTLFGYLAQAQRQGARLDFIFGDGRIALRDRPAQSLDVLVLDAFSSGSIPVHLLTVEAFDEYLRVLRPSGVALLHVSNKMLDLLPVIYANAVWLDVLVCENSNAGRVHPDAELTEWAALTRCPETFNVLQGLSWWRRPTPAGGWPRPWTDRYSNLFGAICW